MDENLPKTELALAPRRELTPTIWGMIKEMAPVMYQSRMFGVSSQDAAAAIMLKGYELGLSISASFELIQVVQGKPGLSPRGAMALLLNDPRIKKITVSRVLDPQGKYLGHECYMARINGFEYTVRYTLEDAQRAGLIKPDSGWAKYPENMCQWRAIGFCADMVAPDIVAGMTNILKAPEAYNLAIDTAGNVIDVPIVPTITLDELKARFDPEMILTCLDGRMPVTEAEIQQVAQMLGA